MLDKADVDKEVHPYAEAFVLMAGEDLEALADDIKENGQLNPIIVDEDDRIVDGRNREAACKLAGVKPKYQVRRFADDDEVARFVLSQNQHRRHITKGQAAMGVAFIYPEPDSRGRGIKGRTRKLLETSSFSRQRLDQARKVLRYSRALAEQVRNGTEKLDDALKQVETEERRQQNGDSKLDELRIKAPDLATRVEEEAMDLDEAYAAYHQRRTRQLESYRYGVAAAGHIDRFVSDVNAILGSMDLVERGVIERDSDLTKNLTDRTIENIAKAVDLLRTRVNEYKEDNDG